MYNNILQIGFKPVTSPDLLFYNGLIYLTVKTLNCEECLVKQRRYPEILGDNTSVGNPR